MDRRWRKRMLWIALGYVVIGIVFAVLMAVTGSFPSTW